jgi:hypothetical protein
MITMYKPYVQTPKLGTMHPTWRVTVAHTEKKDADKAEKEGTGEKTESSMLTTIPIVENERRVDAYQWQGNESTRSVMFQNRRKE